MANVTIPSLPIWGTGPNPLTGSELFVISPTSSTATPSSQLSVLNLAKFPGILPGIPTTTLLLNPTSIYFAAYNGVSGAAISITPNQLQISQGNIPAGGTVGQALVKLSSTNFDDGWGSVGVPGGGTGASSFAQYALIYGNNTGTLGSTNTATSSVLVTDATTGTPSLSSTLPAAVQLNITQVGTIGTGTWNGTVISPSFGGTGASNNPASAKILVGQSSSTTTWQTLVGDLSLTAGGTATIANNAVTAAKLGTGSVVSTSILAGNVVFTSIQTMTGLSVMGVAGTATANPNVIVGTAGQYLQINAGGTAALFAAPSIASSQITGVIVVANGGTGDATMTAHGVLLGNGTSAINVTPAPGSAQVFLGQGASSDPAFTTVVGDWTITAAGTATIANNAVTAPKLATGSVVSTSILAGNVVFTSIQTMTGLSVMGVAGTATTNANVIVGTSATLLQVNNGGTGVLFGQASLTTMVTGILPIANGGTNASVAATAIVNLGGVSLTAANQTLSAGFNVTPYNLGTSSAGTTITIAYGNGSLQKLINNSTFTLAATTASDGEADVLVTNGASASTITISNFSVGSSTGDTYTTANTQKFIFMARTINGSATYKWAALQ